MTKEEREVLMKESKETLVKLCSHYSHEASKYETKFNEACVKIAKLEAVIERGNKYDER